jgi:peptidoglycan hydrolase-like protein with peptidoglycan-binding domain
MQEEIMITKLPNNAGVYVTQTETHNKESETISIQSQETVRTNNSVQYSTAAHTMKGDLALSGVLSKSMIEDYAKAGIAETKSPFVPTSTPDITGPRELKLGSKGLDVQDVQTQLNEWRAGNSLPPISISGEFTEETAEAVRLFQRATNLPATGAMDSLTTPRLNIERNPDFKQLDHETKLSFTSAYSALENDPAGRENLLALVQDQKFAYLISPNAQTAAINGFMASPTKINLQITDKKVLDAAILEKNKNFSQLPEETKRDALNTLFFFKPPSGNTIVTSNEVSNLVTNPNFAKLTAKQQSQFLEIIRDRPDPNFNLPNLLRDLDQMTPEVRAKAINIAYDNAQEASIKTGDWKRNDQQFRNLRDLLQDPSFIQSTPEEQLAQLGGLSGRTGLEI